MAAASCRPIRRTDDRFWAYLCDPMPTLGPQRLRDQALRVDDIARRAHRRIERYLIDSGGQRSATGESLRLQDLITEIRIGRLRVTLVVADASVLSWSKSVRTRMIYALHEADVVLKDATGELHPARKVVGADPVARRTMAPRLQRCSQVRG